MHLYLQSCFFITKRNTSAQSFPSGLNFFHMHSVVICVDFRLGQKWNSRNKLLVSEWPSLKRLVSNVLLRAAMLWCNCNVFLSLTFGKPQRKNYVKFISYFLSIYESHSPKIGFVLFSEAHWKIFMKQTLTDYRLLLWKVKWREMI